MEITSTLWLYTFPLPFPCQVENVLEIGDAHVT